MPWQPRAGPQGPRGAVGPGSPPGCGTRGRAALGVPEEDSGYRAALWPFLRGLPGRRPIPGQGAFCQLGSKGRLCRQREGAPGWAGSRATGPARGPLGLFLSQRSRTRVVFFFPHLPSACPFRFRKELEGTPRVFPGLEFIGGGDFHWISICTIPPAGSLWWTPPKGGGLSLCLSWAA